MTAANALMSAVAPQCPNSEPLEQWWLWRLNSRTEGTGARATGRIFGKSHSTTLRWEGRLANHVDEWSPPAPGDREVTLEGDEVYTRVSENRPPL
jgi:hypothetical protein